MIPTFEMSRIIPTTDHTPEALVTHDNIPDLDAPPTSVFSLAPKELAAVKAANLKLADTLTMYSELNASHHIRHKLKLRNTLTETRNSMSDLESTIAQLISQVKGFADPELDIDEIDIDAKSIYLAGVSAGSNWFSFKADCTKRCLLDLELDLEGVIGGPYRSPWGSAESVTQSLVYSYKTIWALRSLVELIERMDGIGQRSTTCNGTEASQAGMRGSKRARDSGEEDEKVESKSRCSKRRHQE